MWDNSRRRWFRGSKAIGCIGRSVGERTTVRHRFWLWITLPIICLAIHATAFWCTGSIEGPQATMDVAYKQAINARHMRGGEMSDKLKDLFPFSIAVFTAILAAALNYRITFSQNLRELYWRQLVPAIQRAIQYTHLRNPSEAEYAHTLAGLSTAIDGVCALYRNVPEIVTSQGTSEMGSSVGHCEPRKGLYPFEPLKTIHRLVSELRPGHASDNACKVRREIVMAWKTVSEAFFRDLGSRVAPTTPVIAGHGSRPRKSGRR